jgi:hypothetical protein
MYRIYMHIGNVTLRKPIYNSMSICGLVQARVSLRSESNAAVVEYAGIEIMLRQVMARLHLPRVLLHRASSSLALADASALLLACASA